jgi:hypothetical protein
VKKASEMSTMERRINSMRECRQELNAHAHALRNATDELVRLSVMQAETTLDVLERLRGHLQADITRCEAQYEAVFACKLPGFEGAQNMLHEATAWRNLTAAYRTAMGYVEDEVGKLCKRPAKTAEEMLRDVALGKTKVDE